MSDQIPDPIQPPDPPSRATLATVLIQAAEGAWMVASDPGGDLRLQRVYMASGWRLGVMWLLGDKPVLQWATAPDGAHWSYGCDRWPSWNAGPDAVALEPLQHLLNPEQREQLRQRLLSCSCWPEPDPPPEPPSMAEIERLYPLEVMAS